MRIDAHNGAPVWGGAEIAVARVLAGLARRGHDVLFHCNRPEVAERAAALGVETRIQHLGGDIALHHAARFARTLRRRRPDALLLGTFRKLWLGTLAARIARVPRVVARVGLETDMPRNAKYRWVFRHWVDAVAFNADGMRTRFLDALPSFDPRSAVTIHTGIRPPPPGGGDAVRAELGIPAGAPVVGAVGRLATQKRYDRLIRALPFLGDGVRVIIAGEGSERGALEELARERGVADRVHLLGHRDAVGPVLDAMDVFVLPSDREGMSNAMLEALHAGVPVVSTDVSGAREALAPARAPTGAAAGVGPEPAAPGIVVPLAGGDDDVVVRDLGSAIRTLLDDVGRLEAAARAARTVAAERFDEERMLDRWEDLLGAEETD